MSHIRSSLYKRNIAEARPPTPDETHPPSEFSIRNEPFHSDSNELKLDDLDDYLDEDFLKLPYNESL